MREPTAEERERAMRRRQPVRGVSARPRRARTCHVSLQKEEPLKPPKKRSAAASAEATKTATWPTRGTGLARAPDHCGKEGRTEGDGG